MFDLSIEDPPIPQPDFIKELEIICAVILTEFKKDNRTFSLTLCNDSKIKELNKQYRNKDCSTDVLSFAMDDGEKFVFDFAPLGDIVISTETAQRQSLEFQISFEEELARLTIHGLLHLLGFDHENSEEEHKEMFTLQDRFMDQFMLSFQGIESSKI